MSLIQNSWLRVVSIPMSQLIWYYIGMNEIESLVLRYPNLVDCQAEVVRAYEVLLTCFRGGHKVLVCGNGGSAADAEHICGELLKKFKRHRAISPAIAEKLPSELAGKLEGSLPAISLVSMSGIASAVANDVSWDTAFAQQALGLAEAGDVLLTLSTSGNSRNCVAASQVVQAKGGKVVALTGARESALSALADVTIRVPAMETYQIQELHLPVYHALCSAVEAAIFG